MIVLPQLPGSCLVVKTTQKSSRITWLALFLELLLPTSAIIFCATFWLVGLLAFYAPDDTELDLKMRNCLKLELDIAVY